jgi:hypothetical protein
MSNGQDTGSSFVEAIEQQKVLRQAIFASVDSTMDLDHLMTQTTTNLVREKSEERSDVYEIDIFQGIASPSWAHFAARLFSFYLGDSSTLQPNLDSVKLYARMVSIFHYVHRDGESIRPATFNGATLQANKNLTRSLGKVRAAMQYSSFTRVLLHQSNTGGDNDRLPTHSDKLPWRLFESGKTIDEITPMVALLGTEIAVTGSSAVSCHLFP